MVTQLKARRLPARKPVSRTAHPPTWPTDGFAKIEQAAAFLSMSRSSIFRLLDAGVIPSAKFHNLRRIPWSSLWELQRKAAAGELRPTQS